MTVNEDEKNNIYFYEKTNNKSLDLKKRIKKFLINGIEKETLVILEVQKKLHSSSMNAIMWMATCTGNSIFYSLFLPIVFWSNLSEFGLMKLELYKEINFFARQLISSFAYSTFITGYIKDYLSLPRPKSPPVYRKLKKSYVDYEFGCPSTHASNACVLFLTIQLFILTFIHPIINMTLPVLILLYISTISMILLICLSRIYFGMHSFLDIFVGIIIGVVVTYINWYFISPIYEKYFYSSVIGPIIQVIFHRYLLMVIHPDPEHYCPCFDDSYSFFCFFDGLAIASWLESRYFGEKSYIKPYIINSGIKNIIKESFKEEIPFQMTFIKPYSKIKILSKLYNLFGIKLIILIREIIGSLMVLCFKKSTRFLTLKICSYISNIKNKNTDNKKRTELILDKSNIKDMNENENEKEESDDDNKKKYHLPRITPVLLSKNIEFLGIGLIIIGNIHLYKYLEI